MIVSSSQKKPLLTLPTSLGTSSAAIPNILLCFLFQLKHTNPVEKRSIEDESRKTDQLMVGLVTRLDNLNFSIIWHSWTGGILTALSKKAGILSPRRNWRARGKTDKGRQHKEPR